MCIHIPPLLPRDTLPTAHPNKATMPHMLTVSAAQPPLLWNTVARLLPLLCSAAGSTPCWQSHSTFNDYLLGPVTFEGLHAENAPWLSPPFPLFPSAFLLGLLSSTCFSPASLLSCHLVQAAFLIIFCEHRRLHSPGIQSSSSSCRDSSGSLGWSHHGHPKAARHTKDSSPTSLQVWQSHPFPVPSTPLAGGLPFSPASTGLPPAAAPQPPLPSLFLLIRALFSS